MIKLFRNLPRRQAGIRQNLLNEGKTSKPASRTGRYFKYAIGEIVLVVIGILIALQINNWNIEKKDNETVAIYKKELLNDLVLDVGHFEQHLQFAKEENKAIDSLRTILNHPNANTDTLNKVIKNSLTFFKRDAWMMIATTEYPLISDNTFTSLQSSGQITILDNTLQEELVSFYGYTRKYTYMVQEIINSKNEIYFDYINAIPAQQTEGMNIVNSSIYQHVWKNVDWNNVQIKFIKLLNTYYELNLKTQFFNSMRLYKSNILIESLKAEYMN